MARYEKLDAEGATESFAVKEVDLQILHLALDFYTFRSANQPRQRQREREISHAETRSSRVGADQERLVRWVARLEFEAQILRQIVRKAMLLVSNG